MEKQILNDATFIEEKIIQDHKMSKEDKRRIRSCGRKYKKIDNIPGTNKMFGLCK